MRSYQTAVASTFAVLIGLASCGSESPDELVAKARTSLAAGDAKSAAILLKTALQTNAGVKDGHCLLGRALLAVDDHQGASIELGKCLGEGASPETVLPDLARSMVSIGAWKPLTLQYGETKLSSKAAQAELKTHLAAAWALMKDRSRADAALQAALDADPGYAPALIMRARLQVGDGKLEAAEKLVDDILAKNPKLKEGWTLKGEILAFQRQDLKAGEAAFRQALAVDKADVAANAHVFGIKLAAVDLEGAKVQAAQMRTVLPQHPQTAFVEAYLAAWEKNFAFAKEKIQSVLRVAPDSTSVLQLAAAIEAESGSMVVAENLYLKAISLDPSLVNARINAARAQMRLGKPGKVLDTLSALLAPESTNSEALGLAGEASLSLGDAPAAERLFRRAAKVKPDNLQARTALAKARLARGDSTEALADLRLVGEQSKDVYAEVALFSAQLSRADIAGASSAIEAVAAKQPSGPLAHELRGRLAVATGDLPGARQAFEKQLAVDPKAFSAVTSLVDLDIREKRLVEAQARAQKAVEQMGNIPAAHLLLARVRESQGATIDEIRKIFADAIKVAPTDAVIRAQLIDTNLRAKQVKEALVAAQSAQSAIPDDIYLLDAVGRTQALAGDTQQALNTFRRAASLDVRVATPHVRVAAIQRELGNTAAAVAALARAIEIDPAQGQAREDLITILIGRKQGAQAVQVAREMQQKAPDAEAGYLLEAATHSRLNKPDEAITVLKLGMSKAANKAEIARQLYRQLLAAQRAREADALAQDWMKRRPDDPGMIYEVSGTEIARKNLSTAETLLRRFLSMRQDHPVAMNNLAQILVTQKKAGARAYINRAMDLLPDQPAFYDTLASVLVSEQDYAQALVAAKKAADLSPAEPMYRLSLVGVALQAGDKATARAELDKLAALGDKFPLQSQVVSLQKSL